MEQFIAAFKSAFEMIINLIQSMMKSITDLVDSAK